jgi:hypothetical protein
LNTISDQINKKENTETMFNISKVLTDNNNVSVFSNIFENAQKLVSLVSSKNTNELYTYGNILNRDSRAMFKVNNEKFEFEKAIEMGDNVANNKYYTSSANKGDNLLFAGGIDRDSKIVSNDITIYDTKWRTFSNERLTKARYLLSSYSDNNIVVFAFGINDNNNISKTIDIFRNNKWSVLKCPYLGRLYTEVIYHENKLYFVGGYDGTKFTNTIMVYDFIEEAWNNINLPISLNVSNLKCRLIIDPRENINNKLYILSTVTKQARYLHRNLVFSVLDKPYNISYNNENGALEFIENKSINVSFQDNDDTKDFNSFNYNYIGSYIQNYYEIIDNTGEEYSMSMWLYIPKENKGETRLVMGDYHICTGEQGSGEYNGIMLHKDRLLPCFVVQKRIIIKQNDNAPEVEYDKWFHVVFTVMTNMDEIVNELETNYDLTPLTQQTENTSISECVFTKKIENNVTSVAISNSSINEPVSTEKLLEKSNTSHIVKIYTNGVLSENKMNFELKFDAERNGLVVGGFDVFNDERKYASNTKISNFKIFNGHLVYGEIINILKNEINMYIISESPKLYYFDVVNSEFKNTYRTLTGTNGIMESFNNHKLVITTFDENKNNYYTFDCRTDDFTTLSENKNMPHIDSCEMNNGVVFSIIENNIVQFKLIPLEKEYKNNEKPINCLPGEKIENNKCIKCPIDQYSSVKNSKYCNDCPVGMTTNNKDGQRQCEISAEFKNKVVKATFNKNVDTLMNQQYQSYQNIMSKITENNENLSALDNNFSVASKKKIE